MLPVPVRPLLLVEVLALPVAALLVVLQATGTLVRTTTNSCSIMMKLQVELQVTKFECVHRDSLAT